MNINEGWDVGIMEVYPQGTNSTMFTECCQTAICDDETKCPKCGRRVVGADAETPHKRGRIRWDYATSHWNRSKCNKH